MSTKTLTITEDAYESLKRLKTENESFSKTILRITGKRPLSDFVGILSPESADELERNIKESRKRHLELHKKRMKRIVGAFNSGHS